LKKTPSPTAVKNRAPSPIPPPVTIKQGNVKRQLITLDRFQSTGNDLNFSKLSAGLMEIMYDMITILPDSMVNEILTFLKFESFIMFAMVSKN
jgi:hypothetical protein